MRTSDLPKIIRRRKSLARLLIVLTAGMAAAILVLTITRDPGPGLDPDSASYLGAARSLASGRGYRIPIASWTSPDTTGPLSHFPPGYPTAIAIPIALGISPLQSGRLVNAIAAAAELALATALIALAAGELAALALALAVLVMPAFVEAHIPVLSEPLFLACLLATFAALHAAANARSEQRRLGWSFASGCAAAAALMTRYAGISTCGAATLWSVLLPGSIRDRLRRAMLATAPWLVVSLAWVLHTRRTGGPQAIRSVGAYGGIGDTLHQGVATVVEWLVPLSSDDTLPGRRWIALAVLVLLLLTIVRGMQLERRRTREPESLGVTSRSDAMLILAAAFLLALCYAAVLLASRLFADPNVPFDDRLLLPLFVLAVIIAATAIRAWWRRAGIVARIVCAVLIVAWLLASYHVSSDDVDWVLENGYDLAGDPWRSSAVLAWARGSGQGHVLYSNWPTAVVLQIGRASHDTPATADTAVLRKFVTAVRDNQGVVLAFDIAAPDMIGPDELLHAPGLRRVARLADGSVFAASP